MEDVMTDFMQRLYKIMPKAPEPQWTGRPMIAFQEQPIRRHAEAFAAALQGLPSDTVEFQNALWVFGETICGEMERRMNAALKLAGDAISYTPAPHVIIKDKP